MLTGCASPDPDLPSRRVAADHTRAASEAGEKNSIGKIVAVVNGEVVSWDEFKPLLIESGGSEALGELVLDRLLQEKCSENSIEISKTDTEREKDLLLSRLSDDLDEAIRLLESIRRNRHLGPVRFQHLLWRNAALRKLVARKVNVSRSDLEQEYQLRYGDLYQARLIVTGTLQQAQQARQEINAGKPFGEVAAAFSQDVSAQRGGILDPVSLADTTYPEIIRDALGRMHEGDVSPPLGLSNGFALLKLEKVIHRDKPDMESVRGELTEKVQFRQQRLLMDELARTLLASADVSVFEKGLKWSPPAEF